MAKPFPLNPKHPERICWGCDKYCPADSLGCGNGSGRTQHPAELLGEDWYTFGDWGLESGIEPGIESGIEPATTPGPD
jgi:hypothetical protein